MRGGGRRKSRELALQALYAMDLTGDWEARSAVWFEGGRSPDSIPFAEKLVSGVLTNRAIIDEKIESHTKNWSVYRMNVIDRNILRIATYELLWCEDIPASASINEALELAKAYASSESRKFLNGILDKLATP